jgi:hypothetical protein
VESYERREKRMIVGKPAENSNLEPEAVALTDNMVIAHHLIMTGQQPAWFKEHYGDGQDIAKRYALPADILLTLALALDLALEPPRPPEFRHIRRKLRALEKARSVMRELGTPGLPALRTKCLEKCELPDGSVEFTFEPDPINTAVQAIDSVIERLSIPAGKGGRRKTLWHHAVRRLEKFVQHYNPALTPDGREELCHCVFDEVRKRHGHRSRSPDREEDEMPRYRDLLARGKRPRSSQRASDRHVGGVATACVNAERDRG